MSQTCNQSHQLIWLLWISNLKHKYANIYWCYVCDQIFWNRNQLSTFRIKQPYNADYDILWCNIHYNCTKCYSKKTLIFTTYCSRTRVNKSERIILVNELKKNESLKLCKNFITTKRVHTVTLKLIWGRKENIFTEKKTFSGIKLLTMGRGG